MNGDRVIYADGMGFSGAPVNLVPWLSDQCLDEQNQ